MTNKMISYMLLLSHIMIIIFIMKITAMITFIMVIMVITTIRSIIVMRVIGTIISNKANQRDVTLLWSLPKRTKQWFLKLVLFQHFQVHKPCGLINIILNYRKIPIMINI